MKNKVQLIGHVGHKPEIIKKDGTVIAKFSFATTEKYKDKEDTQWHRIICFGKQAEAMEKYVDKGSKLVIEGKLKYGNYEKDGVKHYTTDIVMNAFTFLSSKKEDDNKGSSDANYSQPEINERKEGDMINDLPEVDDLPF